VVIVDLKDLTKVVDEHTDNISSLVSRVGNIEVINARTDVQMQNLIKSLDSLTGSIKLMLFGALGTTIGFMIWYVQKL
jgi:hypothetical protein